MNAHTLTAGLATERMGRRVVWAEEVDSTNDRAVAALRREPLPEGVAFVASRQTRGKGTGGQRWYSDDAAGLWLSLVLQAPARVHPLSFLPCIALVDVLAQDYGIAAHLKWPNDVLVEHRKLAGCLVESQQQPGGQLAWVVGLGVNLNQTNFPAPIAATAVSMRMVTGWTYPREPLFQALMARIEHLYDRRADLIAMWRARTRMLGRRVRARRNGATIGATVLDVSSQGHLQVVLDGGAREEWLARVDLDVEP